MLSRADFLVRFPEFYPKEDLVESKLEEALLQLNPEVYGDSMDLAQGYLAAHLLSINPLSKNARKLDQGTDYSTPYGRSFYDIRRQLSPRGFVT